MKSKMLLRVAQRPFATIVAILSILFFTSTNAQDIPVTESLNNDQVARLVRYEVKAAQQETFRKVISEYVIHSMKQESNILSEAYYEEENTSVLWIIERWSNKEAFEKIRKSSAMTLVERMAETALAKPAKIIYVKDLEPLTKDQWRRVADKNDKPITIMLFVDSKAGTENEFKKVYHSAMPQFRTEPGVVNYQLSQLNDDSTQFVTYEKFRNEAAFQYHLKFPPIQPVIDYLETSIKKQPFQNGIHRLIEFTPMTRN